MTIAPGKHVAVVDGSNLATEGRTTPSLRQLDEAVRAYAAEDPEAEIVVVVDASFEHRIDPSERTQYVDAELHGELVSPPAGAIGRGDAFVLRIAERTGARVLSNDSFQEFHGEHPWLFDKGRLVGGKPVPGVGWIFTPRVPVRGPKSRQASGKQKREEAQALSPSVKAAELAKAAKKVAARRPPVLPDGSTPKVGDVWVPGRAASLAAPQKRDGKKAKRDDAKAATVGPGDNGQSVEVEAETAVARTGAADTGAAVATSARAKKASAALAAKKLASEGKASEPKEKKLAAAQELASSKKGVKSKQKATAPKAVSAKAPKAPKAAKAAKAEGKRAAVTRDAAKKSRAAHAAAEGAEPERPAAKKPAAKKATAEKTAAKKATAEKAAAKKATAEKTAAKKATAEKAAAKKATAEKAAAKHAAGKRAGANKSGPAAIPANGSARAGAARSNATKIAAVQEAIGQALAEAVAPATETHRDASGRPDQNREKDGKGGRHRRRRNVGPPPAVNEPLAFITFVATYPLDTELEGEVVSFTSHGAMVDVDLPGGGVLHSYIPLAAMGDPPPTKAREVLTRGERRRFVLVALDPPRRVAELAFTGAAVADGASGS